MQYVKFGSRRGKEGEIKLLDIFYNHNIVFAEVKAGAEKVKEKKFLKGTRIMIADGLKVVALGIAETDSDSLDKFNIKFNKNELDRVNISYWVIAAKVKIYKLEENDYFSTTIGKFYHVKNKEKIKLTDELLEKYSK
ncbi:ATPase [uncultured Brachyspira sp.]|uniref:ATPase n=1 Tax=uncultured Brachyspira sp. TaxID=221953 RepID=UPI00261ABB89|nr:ATPase [uncultured Brachyspira sp.]